MPRSERSIDSEVKRFSPPQIRHDRVPPQRQIRSITPEVRQGTGLPQWSAASVAGGSARAPVLASPGRRIDAPGDRRRQPSDCPPTSHQVGGVLPIFACHGRGDGKDDRPDDCASDAVRRVGLRSGVHRGCSLSYGVEPAPPLQAPRPVAESSTGRSTTASTAVAPRDPTAAGLVRWMPALACRRRRSATHSPRASAEPQAVDDSGSRHRR